MNRWLFVLIGNLIIVLEIVDSGLTKIEPHSSPGQDELRNLNFENIKQDFRENDHQMLKTINESGFIRLPVENGDEEKIKSKTKISLTSNIKSEGQSEYDCNGTDIKKNWPTTRQPLNTNKKVEITQMVQKAVENLEIKELCPSHQSALQITQQITEKTIPAPDSILFINDNQNVLFSSEKRNQSEYNKKQKTNKTEIEFQKNLSTNTTPSATNPTTENDGIKNNFENDRDDTILKSNSITCLHSTKKGFRNLENATMICNDTSCVLKASSQKSTSWLCGSFICNVAKGLDLKNYDGKDKLVMDCSAEDRSLIAAPLKCLPDEKFANNKCRKIYKV